jgi:hypothetical protein
MRAVGLLLLTACAHTPPPALPAPARPADVVVAPAPASQEPAGDRILAPGTPVSLPDGEIVVKDDCVVVGPECRKIQFGEIETVFEKWALYRDQQGRFRLRSLSPRVLDLRSSGTVTMRLGDTVRQGSWRVQWTGVHEAWAGRFGLFFLGKAADSEAATSLVTEAHPKLSIASKQSLHFDLDASDLPADPTAIDAEVTVAGREVDEAMAVRYGEPLDQGLFRFPDGLRVEFKRHGECSYDDGCTDYFAVKVFAVSGQEKSEQLEKKKPRATVLGHKIELSGMKVIVR